MKRTIKCAAAVAFAVTLLMVGCTTIPDRFWSAQVDPQTLTTPQKSQLMVIEIKEDGSFHKKEQFSSLQRWLDKESTSDPIVIFVHGWHHNAGPNDQNRKDFTSFIGKIEADTCLKHRAAASACPSLDAIYVGWRGDSVDYPIGSDILDFWTIWGRKNVSKKVGEGGLTQIIQHIRQTHPGRNVIVAGHSLGASALFYSIKDSLSQVAEDNYEYIMMNPAVGSDEFEAVEQPLNRVAAAQTMRTMSTTSTPIDPLMMLSRTHRKVIVLQALGDLPVGILYRLAFIADQPIGFDKKRTTHVAYACRQGENGCDHKSNQRNSDFAKAEVDAGRANDYCSIFLAQKEFVLETNRAGPNDETCWENFSKAVWVVSGEDSVSRSHGDIFNGVQERALADLISQRLAMPVQ